MIVCGGVGQRAQLRCEQAAGTHGHHERVAEAGHRVRELVRELDVVVVEPAAVDDGEAVEARHALLREQTGEQVADDAADSMRRKDLRAEIQCERTVAERKCQHTHIETVVVVEQELELRGKVADGARHNAVENSSRCVQSLSAMLRTCERKVTDESRQILILA